LIFNKKYNIIYIEKLRKEKTVGWLSSKKVERPVRGSIKPDHS
jgi:uncharacterized protein YlbG (UPF0298 family)